MYYYDVWINVMVYYIYINDERVLESVGSVFIDKMKFSIKYYGGMFLFKVNDIIFVCILYV